MILPLVATADMESVVMTVTRLAMVTMVREYPGEASRDATGDGLTNWPLLLAQFKFYQ